MLEQSLRTTERQRTYARPRLRDRITDQPQRWADPCLTRRRGLRRARERPAAPNRPVNGEHGVDITMDDWREHPRHRV